MLILRDLNNLVRITGFFGQLHIKTQVVGQKFCCEFGQLPIKSGVVGQVLRIQAL